MVKDLLSVFFNKHIKHKKATADSFLRSQWQLNYNQLSYVFLSYKCFHALAFVVILVLSLIDYGHCDKILYAHYIKWPIFLTNWSLFLDVFQALIAVYLLIEAAYSSKITAGVEDLTSFRMRRIFEWYWVVNSTAIVCAIGVTVVYWLFVFDPEIHKLNLVNILVHSINSLLMILDFFLNGHQFPILHVIYPILVVIAYSSFNCLYYISGGTNRLGDKYVYKVMDWSNPMKCINFTLSGIFLVIIVHTVLCLLSQLKRVISHKIRIFLISSKKYNDNVNLNTITNLRV